MNFIYYKIFYLELIARSSEFPKIKFNEIYDPCQSIQKSNDLYEMQKSYYELSF